MLCNIITLLAVLAFVTSTKVFPKSYDKIQNFQEASVMKQLYLQAPFAVQEDANLPVPDLVTKYGYPIETHYVTTIDGYILCLHRIKHGKNGAGTKKRPPFFVQHGLLSSSIDFLISGPEKALGYLLADNGFDVWLGNFRGNTYSRNHTFLNPDKDNEFWDYSWHEIGIRDLPAMVDYVLKITGEKKLFHTGHSQGTTTFYVMCSQLPEYNDKIIAHISLAPIAFMKDMTSPLFKLLANFTGTIHALLEIIGIREFNPPNWILEEICDDHAFQFLCTNSLFAVCGFNKNQMNTTLLPIIMAHTPAGSSTRQMVHYAQGISSGHFRQWDYGLFNNMKKYGSVLPPDYDLGRVTADVYLLYSKNDWLSADSDVTKLYKKLGNCKGKFLVADNKWNHLDYLFGIDAPSYTYNKVISLAKRY